MRSRRPRAAVRFQTRRAKHVFCAAWLAGSVACRPGRVTVWLACSWSSRRQASRSGRPGPLTERWPLEDHGNLSLWRHSHSRPSSASNCYAVQLFNLSSLRRSLGLFQGEIRRNRVPARRPREVLLAGEGPLVFPLQAMRVRHTLQVQKTEPQLPYCSQCCELRARRAERRTDSQSRRRGDLDLGIRAAAVDIIQNDRGRHPSFRHYLPRMWRAITRRNAHQRLHLFLRVQGLSHAA